MLKKAADEYLDVVSSALSQTEVLRVAGRDPSAPRSMQLAKDVLDRFNLIAVDWNMLTAACRVDPPSLRTLDAIHLASALSLGEELDGFVTYDKRLASAARDAGLTVIAPTPDD